MLAILISSAALMFIFRLRLLHRMWGLPLKNGEGFFLAQRVGPDFYRTAGAPVVRRYRLFIFVPLVLDAPLVVWLAVTERYVPMTLEQLGAMMVSIAIYNVMVVYFSARATPVCGLQEDRPATTLQLSMSPRRLRDHMVPAIEATIVAATILSLGLLARSYVLSAGPGADHTTVRVFRGGMVLTVWVLYWQIGFLLLKGLFVRWRMPLPANRKEDFQRWRGAWLRHHVRIFDAVRLFCALMLLMGTLWMNYARMWPRTTQIVVFSAAALATIVYVAYALREERRLRAAERELKPIEMVKEFPRPPIAEGRYLAGGLLYFNPDNPGVVVRSSTGVALNIAHRATYAWFAYFIGLIALMTWMARLAH
jgi:hypothetical protein